MTTAIVFDMDGTLFQTNRILEPALEVTFEQLRQNGYWTGPTPLEKYQEIMGVPLTVVWQTLCPELPKEMHEACNKRFQLALIELIQSGQGALYDEVESTLEKLAENYPLFIASNGQTAYLQAIIETYHLHKWIKGTYSIDRVTSGNKSELVSIVLTENDVHQGFVVGDRLSDINAALDNKLTSIGVRFDFAQEDELAKADYIVDRFTAILDIVNNHN